MKLSEPSFDTTPYAARTEKPWGWELHWTPAHLPYVGKILHIRAGARLSLQVHDVKEESWLLIAGHAKAVWEEGPGKLVEVELRPGQGYSCGAGRQHRLVGITDCAIVEVSTPEIGTTWRLEDDFGRPHETEELRRQDRAA